MEIGRSSLEALAMVGDDTVVADGVFKELLKSAFVVASGGVVEDAAIESKCATRACPACTVVQRVSASANVCKSLYHLVQK